MVPEETERSRPPSGHALAFGAFRLFPDRHQLFRGAEPVAIGSRALQILLDLVSHAGELVTKERLIARAWPDTVV